MIETSQSFIATHPLRIDLPGGGYHVRFRGLWCAAHTGAHLKLPVVDEKTGEKLSVSDCIQLICAQISRMTSGYKIVRVPGNMVDLERLVGNAMAEGWRPSGTPFFDRDLAPVVPGDDARGRSGASGASETAGAEAVIWWYYCQQRKPAKGGSAII